MKAIGVADMGDPVAAQDRNVAGRRAGAVGLFLHGARTQVAQMREIGAGQHQVHARRLPCRFGRAEAKGALGDRRAQHEAMQQAGRRKIVGVVTLPGDEDMVLDAQYRGAHPEFRCNDGHDFPVMMGWERELE